MIVVIQAGNSDNKLTQKEWSDYVIELKEVINNKATSIHFFGGSSNWEPWQNVCWVIELLDINRYSLIQKLEKIRIKYFQDSIAWSQCSNTLFI